MPFDGKPSDYTKLAPPAPQEFTRDNPPTRMSDAIVMAVADVEAQERAGVEYDWGECERCTAGAVCRRIGLTKNDWGLRVRGPWASPLIALSHLTMSVRPDSELGSLDQAFQVWPEGFSDQPDFDWRTSGYTADPIAFKRDMLALADRLRAEGS